MDEKFLKDFAKQKNMAAADAIAMLIADPKGVASFTKLITEMRDTSELNFKVAAESAAIKGTPTGVPATYLGQRQAYDRVLDLITALTTGH